MITTDQAYAILIMCQGADGRKTIDELVAASWARMLGDINVADAQDAVVEHYSQTRDFAMPADIRTRAIAIANRRAGAERAKGHAPGCYGIVTEHGAAAAAQIRALPSRQGQQPISDAHQAFRDAVAKASQRMSVPDFDKLDKAEQIRQRAILRAKHERYERTRRAA